MQFSSSSSSSAAASSTLVVHNPLLTTSFFLLPSSATAQLAGRRPARMHAAVPRGIEKVGEGILPEVREFIRDTNLEHTFFTGSMILFGSFQKRPTDSVFSARSRRPGGALSKKSIPILRLPPTFTTSPYKNNRGGQVAHTRTKRRSARLRVQHALPYCRTGGGGGGGRRRQAAEEARRRRQRGGGAWQSSA